MAKRKPTKRNFISEQKALREKRMRANTQEMCGCAVDGQKLSVLKRRLRYAICASELSADLADSIWYQLQDAKERARRK